MRGAGRGPLALGLLVAAAVMALGGSASALTATWTGGSANWNTASRWSWSGTCANCVPGVSATAAANNATVVIGSNVTVTVNTGVGTGSTTIASITVTNGTLTGSGTNALKTSGDMVLNGGDLTNWGGAITVGGTLYIQSASSTYTHGTGALQAGAMDLSAGAFTGTNGRGTIDVTGALAVSGSHNFTGSSRTSATIHAGSLSVGTTSNGFTGGAGAITVDGALSITNGTYTHGSGALQADSMSLSGGSFAGGNATGDITCTNALSVSGSHAFTASSSNQSAIHAGSLSVNNTSNGFNGGAGTITVDGALSIIAGTYTPGAGALQADSMMLSGGSFTGGTAAGTVSVTNAMILSGSHSFTASSSTSATIGAASFSQRNTSNGFTGGGGAITIGGTFDIQGGTYTHGNGALKANAMTLSGGSFAGGSATGTITSTTSMVLSGTHAFTASSSSSSKVTAGSLTLQNSASFTAGAGLVTVNGTLDIQSGTYNLGSGALAANAMTGSGGSFVGGAATGAVGITTSMVLSGSHTFTASSSSSSTFTAASLSIGNTSNGFTAGAGTVTVSGTMTMTSGTYTHGSGALSANAMALSGGTFAGGSATGTVGVTNAMALSGSHTFTASSSASSSIAVGSFSQTNSSNGFTGSAGSMTVTGDLALSGSTFTAPSATLQINGKFNKTGGTFVANGGTVVLAATGSVTHTFGGAIFNTVTVGTDSGLVGYWKLDETSGTTIADQSAFANNGTLSGGTGTTTPATGFFFSNPSAVTFNGSTGYATLGIAGIPATDASQTIALWFKLSSTTGQQNMVVLTDTQADGVQIGIKDGLLKVWGWGGGDILATTAAPSTGVWHHVAYTWDGTTNKMYLDGGVPVTSTNAHQSGTVTIAYFGTWSPNNDMLNGALDDVRLYNRPLSAAEVNSLATKHDLSSVGGTHSFSDAFTSTGTFTIGTGTVTGSSSITVGGSFLNTGGTFSGTGAVSLLGTTSGLTLVPRGATFSSLTVNGPGGTYTFAGTVPVTNDLTITAGTVTGTSPITVGGALSNAGTYTGSGAVSITGNFTNSGTYSGTGTLTVNGDLSNSGSYLGTGALSVKGNWTNTGTYGGSGAVTLTGTGSKTITSGGGRFNGLTINGGGTYTLQDRFSASGATVTLTNSTLACAAQTARVGQFSFGGTGTFSVGTGTLIVDGSSSQSLPLSTFAGLRIEPTSETNLVGYWKLDEGAGAIFDSSGNGNGGTLSSGTTGQTSVPSATIYDNPKSVAFNGSNGYATLGINNLPATSAAQTIAFWANISTTAGTQNMVALNAAGASIQVGIRDYGGGPTLTAWGQGGVNYVAVTPPSTGAWHHIAYVYDGAGGQAMYIDGVSAGTATATNQSGTVTSAYLGTYAPPNAELYSGSLDDVRVYSVALSSAQVAALAGGRYAGTGGGATVSLASNTTVNGQLEIDSGTLAGNGKTMNAALTTAPALVRGGTYDVGSAAQTFNGGLSVQGGGALTLASSSSSVKIASGKALSIDGTLNASSTTATIQAASGTYDFWVGATNGAAPTLNITGLAVKNTTANGMRINGNGTGTTTATTTFTNFNNIAFSNGTAGGTLLQIYAPSLALVSNGCTFDASTTYTVKAIGDGFTAGVESTQTRALFASATCTAGDCWGTKSDNENGHTGTPTASSLGAIVQFVSNAPTDTVGTIEGFPTAAFSWNDGSYYSTYVAFHDASGTADTVYVRDTTGAAKYSWSTASGETIVGTPRWTTEGTGASEKHYVYVALASGKVYRLRDNGSSLTPDTASTGWSMANPYDCACAITTPITADATNLYWAGRKTSDSSYRVWGLGQANKSAPTWSPMRPSSLSTPVTTETAITSASLATWTSGSTYVFLGQTGYIAKANVTSGNVSEYNSNPGAGKSILGRILVVSLGTNRVLAGDDGGSFWSISPSSFTNTNKQWGYTALAGTDQFKSAPVLDYGSGYVHFGSEGGRLIVLDVTSGSPVNGYPMTSLTTDPMRSALLYRSGIIAVGTTTGKLFFVNRRTNGGGPPALMREYYFGATEEVSGIAYDPNANKYMVTTSSSTSKDGRFFTIDASDSTLTDLDGTY